MTIIINKTFQGLVGAVFEGVGVSVGSFVGGVLFNKIGGSATFRYFGIGALVFLVVHILIQKLYARFNGSIGKAEFDGLGEQNSTNHTWSSKQVVFVANAPTADMSSMPNTGDRASGKVLLPASMAADEEQGFRDVPLK